MIPQHNVKISEQCWLDTFVFNTASTALLTTSDTICIGMVPPGRNITSIEVYLPNGFSPTNSTINVGVSGSASIFISSSTLYAIGNQAATGSTIGLFNKVTMNNILGFPYLTTQGTVVVSGGTFIRQMTKVYLSLGTANMTLSNIWVYQFNH